MAFKATSALTSKLKTHLTLCGFTTAQVNSLLGDIVKWESNNGPQWTIDRLKSMKELLIQQFSNKCFIHSQKSDWVSKKNFNNYRIPKGVWGVVFKMGLSSDNIKPLIKALSALMAYTGFKSKELTHTQACKTIEAFTLPFKGDEEYLEKFTQRTIKLLRHKSYSYLIPKQPDYEFSFAGLNSAKPSNQFEKTWLGSFQASLAYRPVMRFLRKRFGLPNDIPVSIHANKWSTFDMLPGNISVIQERGFKARVVAMPSSGIQVCLKPLHRALANLNKSLIEDCTYDHESGALFARDSLAKGKRVYSVDLSSATDRFPRSYSLAILRELGFTDEADLINYICNDDWKVSEELSKFLGKETIQYSVGQPQGMYASFPLFAYSHHLVVKTLIHMNYEAGRISKDDFQDPNGLYRILGDDIVFNNEPLAKSYIKLMSLFGVDISLSKSLISYNLAEFASFLVSKDFFNKPKKVPNAEFFTSYLTYVKTFGYKAISLVPKSLQNPLTTLVELPENYGGLGLNPFGKPRYVRESIVPYLYRRRTAPSGDQLVTHLFRMSLEYPSMKDSLAWLYEQCNQIEERMKYSLPGMAKDIITNHREEIFHLKSDLQNSRKQYEDLFTKYNDHLAYSKTLLDQYSSISDKLTGYETIIATNRRDLKELKDSYKKVSDESGSLQAVIKALKDQNKEAMSKILILEQTISELNSKPIENNCNSGSINPTLSQSYQYGDIHQQDSQIKLDELEKSNKSNEIDDSYDTYMDFGPSM